MSTSRVLNRASKLFRRLVRTTHRERIPFLIKLIVVFSVVSSTAIMTLEAVNPHANIQSLFDG